MEVVIILVLNSIYSFHIFVVVLIWYISNDAQVLERVGKLGKYFENFEKFHFFFFFF